MEEKIDIGWHRTIQLKQGQRIQIQDFVCKDKRSAGIVRNYKVEKLYPHLVLLSYEATTGDKIRTCFTYFSIEKGRKQNGTKKREYA